MKKNGPWTGLINCVPKKICIYQIIRELTSQRSSKSAKGAVAFTYIVRAGPYAEDCLHFVIVVVVVVCVHMGAAHLLMRFYVKARGQHWISLYRSSSYFYCY